MTAYTTAEFDTRERAQDRRYVGMRIILVCICAERENAKLCDGSVTVKQAPSMGRAAHRVPPGSWE